MKILSLNSFGNFGADRPLGLTRVVIALLLCSLATSSNAWTLFGPKNYDECILEGMKGVTSDKAANAVIQACLNKFSTPKKTCTPSPFAKKDYANLEFTASADTRFFRARVYNAHKEKNIQSIKFEISAPNINPPQTYRLDFYPIVAPQSSGDGIVELLDKPMEKWNWRIVEILGCEEK
jgi:hypothetical protein